ncbi:MAG TPA: DUF349 domain-containing protein [Bacteroidales bacterium]|jgi:hypothetical protein|nr:DUF349 domain-containing protein [Bacteroidales bacterium]
METTNINDKANLNESEVQDESLNSTTEIEPVFQAQIEEEPVIEDENVTEEDDISEVIMKYPVIDYSSLNKQELIDKFKELLTQAKIEQIKNEVEQIKTNFYKKLKQENDELKKKFLEEGGNNEDFQAKEDLLEPVFKELYNAYRDKRQELIEELEKQKKENYQKKLEIIEKINELTTKPESLKSTMDEFHDLSLKWKEIGVVPQQFVKDIYNKYNLARDNFYNWLKLNQEARDYDLKRNLEAKIELCEKAEQLILEENVTKALGQLQILHERWREIGPVYPDKKEEIWERFKEATHKIHKNHQEFFNKRREEEENNLKAKTILCEIAEEIAGKIYTRYKDWEESTKQMINLQQRWRTIGMVPKSENAAIYKRFRNALDQFFAAKKEFYSIKNEEENKNLQLKTDLCIRAEALKDSNDWKKTTFEIINLQKEWKKIGPVSRKDSDAIWQRFRAACNEFFDRKTKHFNSLGNLLEENLTKKEELLKKLEEFDFSDDPEQDLMKVRQIQKEWFEIGPLTESKQEEIQNRYKKAVQNLFANLKIDEKKKNTLNFKLKIDSLLNTPNSKDKLLQERTNLAKELHKLENDLKVLENNIGFFSKSKNAENLVKDFAKKIDEGRLQAEKLKEQIKYIDNLMKQN